MPNITALPAAAHHVALAELGRFHDRQGDQSYLAGDGLVSSVWGRYHQTDFRQTGDQVVEGTDFQLSPEFDGDLWLLQAGVDVFADLRDDGSQIRAGLFFSHAESSGDVKGNVLARLRQRSGTLETNSDGVGATLTYAGQSGWYLDFVGLYSWLDASGQSFRGIEARFDGTSMAASLEGAYPIAVFGNWTLEPQAQLVWQRVKFSPSDDDFSRIEFDAFEALAARVGMRFEGEVVHEGSVLQPFLSADVWHNFSQKDRITFNTRSLISDSQASVLELGGGLGVLVTPTLSLHFRVGWGTNLGGEHYSSRDANVGMRFTW